MTLTQEQVKAYRQKYGLDTEAPAPAQSAPTPQAPTESPEQRIQRLRSVAQPPQEQNVPRGTSGASVDVPGSNFGTEQEKKPGFFRGTVLPFAKEVVKSPIKSLLVKPAVRTGQAIGAAGVYAFGNEEQKRRADEELKKDFEINVPILGKYNIEAVKPGMSGVKQAAGEGLEAASYLVGSGAAPGVASGVVKNTLGTAVKTGVIGGLKSGALYGAGAALQKDKGFVDVAKGAATGAAIGGAVGGALPIVGAGVKKLVGGAVTAPGKIVHAVENKLHAMDQPPAVQKALHSGIDQNVVDFIRNSSPDDTLAFSAMYDIAEKAGKDLRYRIQPKQIAGKTILDRADHLIKVKDLGVGQTKAVLSKLDKRPQDITPVFTQFLSDLQKKGVTVVKRGGGAQMVSSGKVPNADLQFYRDMYRLLQPTKKGQTLKTFQNLHQLRQRIFADLNLAKARQQPFSDDVAAYGEHLRAMLAEPINAASKNKYNLAQRKTADALGALRDFTQLMGYKGDLERITAKDLKAGEVASRMLGNASDRPMSVLANLDETAQKYGYKAKGNYLDQIQFADLLENVFGTTQTRSLRGQVGRGTLDAVSEATGAANEAGSGNILALGARALKHIVGKSKDDQIKALGELVKTQAGVIKPKTVFGTTIKNLMKNQEGFIKVPGVAETKTSNFGSAKSMDKLYSHASPEISKEAFKMTLNGKMAKSILEDTKKQIAGKSGMNNPTLASALDNVDLNGIKSWGDFFTRMSEAVGHDKKAVQTIKNHLQTRLQYYTNDPVAMTKIAGPEFVNPAKAPVIPRIDVRGGKEIIPKAKNIHPEDREAIVNFIDNVRLKKGENVALETAARRLAERHGVNPDVSNAKLANSMEALIAKGKQSLRNDGKMAREIVGDIQGKTAAVIGGLGKTGGQGDTANMIHEMVRTLGGLDKAVKNPLFKEMIKKIYNDLIKG